MKIKGGELFVIELSDGSVAVGKVIWRGKKSVYRRQCLIAIYSRVSEPMLSSVRIEGLKPRKLYYVLTDEFEARKGKRWSVCGQANVTEDEKQLNVRVYAGDLHIGEQYMGNATKEDYARYLDGNFTPNWVVEREIHRLFRVPMRKVSSAPLPPPPKFPWSEAIEWSAALGRSTSFAPVKTALSAVVKAKYAEMDECHEALAAAEVVAAAKGRPAENLPEEVKQWVAKHQSKFDLSLVDLAIRAVERVRADSELQQEWDESDSLNDWKKQLTGLLKRLKA
jgi:hypothetical protein